MHPTHTTLSPSLFSIWVRLQMPGRPGPPEVGGCAKLVGLHVKIKLLLIFWKILFQSFKHQKSFTKLSGFWGIVWARKLQFPFFWLTRRMNSSPAWSRRLMKWPSSKEICSMTWPVWLMSCQHCQKVNTFNRVTNKKLEQCWPDIFTIVPKTVH